MIKSTERKFKIGYEIIVVSTFAIFQSVDWIYFDIL